MGGLRLTSSTSQGEGCPSPALELLDHGRHRQSGRCAVSSPARDPPCRILPAVEWSFGVTSRSAEKSRPDRNACGSGTFITSSSEAPIGPMPGAHQPLAQFVALVPVHQPGFDLANSPLERRSPGRGEQLLRELWHIINCRNALQQRLDLVEPLAAISPSAADSRGSCWLIACDAGSAVAHACQHQRRLLFRRLHRHEPHPRPGSWLRKSPPHQWHRFCCARRTA